MLHTKMSVPIALDGLTNRRQLYRTQAPPRTTVSVSIGCRENVVVLWLLKAGSFQCIDSLAISLSPITEKLNH